MSIYLPEHVAREMAAEARRLDRPISWLILRAWRLAYAEVQRQRLSREALQRRA